MDERRKSLEAFRGGEVRVLIATDLAARGIDIRELPFVVNMTLPDTAETYLHRIGRVGRADRTGMAISIVATCEEKVWFCRGGKKPPCADTRTYDRGGEREKPSPPNRTRFWVFGGRFVFLRANAGFAYRVQFVPSDYI